jgi:hypothetical protein
MSNIITETCVNSHFKHIDFITISIAHQTLLLNNGFDVDTLGQIYESHLLTIKNKG